MRDSAANMEMQLREAWAALSLSRLAPAIQGIFLN